jgi:Asp-tRNA(Asn)/Glu-tRNA(Gln) amidotransferase A subunit family amidase
LLHSADEVIRQPAREQARLVAERTVSPVELVEASLERIAQVDVKLGAFITVSAEQALDAARAAEKAVMLGEAPGPLHGVPIAVKDIEATAGIRTTLGSRYFAETVPDFDSVVVERVRASGAIIVGKTNTPEIAIHMDTITDNEVRGACNNPWDLSRTTSGSSGGSAAALVADMCQVTVGSDGGGSIRIPASFCGVFGLKPTNGRVPRARGLGKPDPNQFSQSGPMSNDVRDSAILLQALAGPHSADPQQFIRTAPPDFSNGIEQGVKGMRVGFSPDFGYGLIDPRVLEQVKAGLTAFEDAGAIVEEAGVQLGYEYADRFWSIFGANAYVQYGHLLEKADLLTPGVREVLTRGKSITGYEYSAAMRTVNELRQTINALFEQYDLLVSPTTSITAFQPGKRPVEVDGKRAESAYGVFPFTYIFNMSGHPAASIPCGFVDGLPVGLQVAARFGDEATLLRAAVAFESARPWRHVKPNI